MTKTTSLRELKIPLLIFLIIELAVLIYSTYDESPELIFAALSGILLFLWSFYSVQRTFYILAFYVAVFPSYASYLRYPYLKLWVFLEVIAIFLLVMFFYDFSQRIMRKEKLFFLKFSLMDKAVALFLVWTLFSAIWGMVNGGDMKYIYTEFYFFGLYIVYFIIRRNFDDLQQLWLVFIVISVIVCFVYIYIAFRETGLGSGFLIKRVSTQQPHLAQLAFPLLLSYFFFKSKTAHKMLIWLCIIPVFLMIFFSQQRGLWVGIIFSTLLLWGFSLIREGVSIKNFLKFVLFLIAASAFIVTVAFFIDKFFLGSTLLTLVERFNTLMKLSTDMSLKVRMGEISHAMQQWRYVPIIGTGFGATINPVILEHYPNNAVDNSYAVFLWKGGIIGLLIYLSITVLFFYRGFYVFKNTHNRNAQRLAAALLAGLAGLMVIALTNSCLAYYRYNIFWAMTLATIEVMYWREVP
ncbi:hypothetical protein EH223_16555 [candidate division KSB1 bacterium]|nr:hypothetical protein [candidate division KSB1 bacterium]RQW00958.1 MAG: hypothetical protein EH223_16555 [candidate division KSB1 bacterium]